MDKPRLCSDFQYIFVRDLAIMTKWLKESLGFVGRDPKSWRVPYVHLYRDGLRLKVTNGPLTEEARELPEGSLKIATTYSFPVNGLREFRAELESRQVPCTEIHSNGPGRDCFLIEDPEQNKWKFWQRQRTMKS